MSDTHKSTRLGDLLVERGAITRTQLKIAVDLQQDRRLHEIQTGISTTEKKELGEILIELGFISRYQLKSGLGWQHKLRRTTFAMAFVAPLLTAACGGGAAGSNTGTNQNTQTEAVSSQPVTNKPDEQSSSSVSSVATEPPQASSSSVASLAGSSSSVSSVSSQAQAPASSSSSAPAEPPPVSSSSSSSKPVASSSSSAPASSSSSSAASSDGEVNGPVVIYWSVPTHRENGDYLDISEIGGYELRYKLKSSTEYTIVDIDSGFTDTYYFDYLQGDFEFELATYDTDGLYSEFVRVNPQ